MRPIVFLDIDGVLNSRKWAEARMNAGKAPYDEFDPYNVRALEHIYDKANCSIVLSSSWRIGSTLLRIERLIRRADWRFAQVPLIGQTPIMDTNFRGDEITAWFERSGYQGKFVCLDDDEDFLMEHNLIQTNSDVGLTMDDARRAIEILNG